MLSQQIKILFFTFILLIGFSAFSNGEKSQKDTSSSAAVTSSQLLNKTTTKSAPVVAQKLGTTYKLNWQYKNFPARVSLYYLSNPINAKIGAMGRMRSVTNPLFANKLPTSDVFVPDGDVLKLAMVVENTTDKKLYFNVVPHDVIPEEFSLGTKFVCACFGHIYSVAPGYVWYRIVSLSNLTPKMARNFTIQHKVLGVDVDKSFDEAKSFSEDN